MHAIKVTAIIVEECPEGKEWNAESVEKKLNIVLELKLVWFGRGLPITCFRNWVVKPTKSK